MSEETDALNARIRQLENQVADMQRLVQDTSDLLDIARANGLDKFLTGHGFWETQGGVTRFDVNGEQVKGSTGGKTGIYFVNDFLSSPSTAAAGRIIGGSNATDGFVEVLATDSTGATDGYVIVDGRNNIIDLTMNYGGIELAGGTASINPYLNLNFGFSPLILYLGVATSVPSRFDTDGMLLYNSTTDKAILRANGVTENLATESYVAANGASYAKLMFWGGA